MSEEGEEESMGAKKEAWEGGKQNGRERGTMVHVTLYFSSKM